jgi:hypothetical protein
VGRLRLDSPAGVHSSRSSTMVKPQEDPRFELSDVDVDVCDLGVVGWARRHQRVKEDALGPLGRLQL